MNIVVTGTLGFDYIMNFSGKFADRIMPDAIHKISLSFLVESLQKQFGGTAGNIAYTLKLLGFDPKIVAPAGNDFEPYRKFLKKKKISLDLIHVFPEVATSSYFVVTDEDHNQIGSFFVGATSHAKELSIPVCDFVLISPTDPTAMISYVYECKQKKLRYMYDPAFQIATFTKEQLVDGISHAEILIGNDYELNLIEQKIECSHAQLTQMVPMIITTLGHLGSRIEQNGKVYEIPVAPISAIVDPTGAGDAYRGGFLSGYLRGLDLQTSGQMGAVAASYTVEKMGTITHSYTMKEFAKRYNQAFQQKLLITGFTNSN